jgi:hypothetical protein
MVSFEIFVKSMPPSLSELKVTPNFCFAFKIPDDPTTAKQHNTIPPEHSINNNNSKGVPWGMWVPVV